MVTLENQNGKFTKSYEVIFGADGAYSKVRKGFLSLEDFNYKQQYYRHGVTFFHIPPEDVVKQKIDQTYFHIWSANGSVLYGCPLYDKSAIILVLLPFEGEFSMTTLNTREKLK